MLARVEYAALSQPPERRGPLATAWFYVFAYCRKSRLAGGRATVLGFVEYLRRRWYLRSGWAVPWCAAIGLVRRTWQRVGRSRADSAGVAGVAVPPELIP